jgi:hypothetical protein
MKTSFRALLPLLLLLTLRGVVQAQFTFTTNNGAITITGYTGSGGAVTIPSTTNGHPVTVVGSNAFSQCSSLTSVTIPNSVTNVEYAAFFACDSLTNATIPDSVTTIGNQAFQLCTMLTGFTIGSNVTTIGSMAFQSCQSVTDVTIPGSVTSIGSQAFDGCIYLNAITVDAANATYSSADGVLFDKSQSLLIQCPAGKRSSYTIPKSVTGIGISAFGTCSSLTNGTIPNSVTNIGDYAFQGCAGLKSVSIPSSVTSIGLCAFYISNNLTNITVDVLNPFYSSIDGVLFNKSQTTLVEYAGGKPGGYTIPNSVTNIGSSAFLFCNRLTGVSIPDSVTTIQDGALEDCNSLTNVTIPKSVSFIGARAFWGNVRRVFFQGNRPQLGSGGAPYCCCGWSQGGSVFGPCSSVNVYYLPGATGWSYAFDGFMPVLWNPTIVINDASFGVLTNRFGFNVTGTLNIPIVVEACTSLTGASWTYLQSRTIRTSFNYFSDPGWTNYPARFYRLRSP